VRPDASSTEPAGTVVDQFPLGEQTADAGAEVILFVSTYVEPSPTAPTTGLPTAPPTFPPTETPGIPLPSREGDDDRD
jgi:serine/threonine-protein kinase